MKELHWIVPYLPCPHCGDNEKGIRFILATEASGVVNYLIVCTVCHVRIYISSLVDQFYDMMNHMPPDETDN